MSEMIQYPQIPLPNQDANFWKLQAEQWKYLYEEQQKLANEYKELMFIAQKLY